MKSSKAADGFLSPDTQLPRGGGVVRGPRVAGHRSAPYLGVGLGDVALDLVHGVRPVGHGPQVEALEEHLVLGQRAWRCVQIRIQKHESVTGATT